MNGGDEVSILICSMPAEHVAKVQANLAHLFERNMLLYTCGDSASVSQVEADSLLRSILFAFGADADGGLPLEVIEALVVDDIDRAYADALSRLEDLMKETVDLWRLVCAEMPPFENIALWDTLESFRCLPYIYDMRFAAHDIPGDIDYQLQHPVPDSYLGIDYVREWLERLLNEARQLHEFDFDEACKKLERICPDYRGLLVNLLDVLQVDEG